MFVLDRLHQAPSFSSSVLSLDVAFLGRCCDRGRGRPPQVLAGRQAPVPLQLGRNRSPVERCNPIMFLTKLEELSIGTRNLENFESLADRANGPLIPEVLSMFPGAPLIHRHGPIR
jgi:hypothetical protein